MPNKNIIIEIEFNSRSRSDNRWQVGLTRAWIEYRMSIFMKYTLQSLKKQTNQNFTALIRYSEASEDIIRDTLKKYEKLPKNIRFIPLKKNLKIQEKLSRGHQFLYLVRLDCDDTYHKSYIQQLQDYQPKSDTVALINQEGYVYDLLNHRMAPMQMRSPNFHTWIYKTDDYFMGTRYNVTFAHQNVYRYKHEVLTNENNRNFMIVVHKKNTENQKLLARYKFDNDPSKVNAILKKFI